DTVGAFLVFLHLLEGEAECVTQLSLAHRKHHAAHPHPAADVLVGWVWGLLSRQLQANRHDSPPRSRKAMSKNRPNAGTFDILTQRAIFGRSNDAEAVVLDLVQPLAARRQLVGFGRKARRDEPGREGAHTQHSAHS